MFSVARFTATRKKDTKKLYIFRLNLKLYNLYNHKYADKRSIAVKASSQNVEIVGKNGLQILTFSRSLQSGKMSPSSRNGGRQTTNAANVRSRVPLCRSRGKITRCLISLRFAPWRDMGPRKDHFEWATVQPRFNEVLDITNDTLRPGQSYNKMYGI